MNATARVAVRFAEQVDFAWCAMQDAEIDKVFIRRAIDQREIVLAELDGKPVGYLRFQYLWCRLPYIGLIHVDIEHRSIGIGRTMLKFLEDYLRLRLFRTLLSSSVVNEAEPQEWHRRMGFSECGILVGINESGVGEVFFGKKL